MIVKKGEHKRRRFKGAKFSVGATGERMTVTLMQFERGDSYLIPAILLCSRAVADSMRDQGGEGLSIS